MSSFGYVRYCSCQHMLFLLSPKGNFSHCSSINHIFYPEDDWLITSFHFKVASCSCGYLTRGVLVCCSLSSLSPPIMYSHPYHTVMFFKNSTLLCPVDMTVNCFTFHHILQLPLANANLYWALGQCFVCGFHSHRSEACPLAQGELWLICDLLEDHFSE
jgi:hypothetical protein